MISIPDENIRVTMQGVIDNFLKPKFISLGMNASGEWLESLTAEASNGVGYIKAKDYTYWLALGRNPNKDQSEEAINHFTRWAGHYIFKKWVEDKGLSINPYAVARKVATKGTSYHPQGTDLVEILNSREVLDYIYGNLTGFLRVQIELEIKRMANNILILA